MSTSVRFSLLGTFELDVEGTTVTADDFERRSGALLLQLLALTAGHRLHREQVMDALWPGAELGSAANSLRKAATFARSATGAPDAIVVQRQVVALFPDREIEVDVEIVEAARADDEESVTAAIDAYRGELLPDLPYAEWAARAREQLRQHLTEVLAAARRWHELLTLDPGNEEATVALMDRALAAGDRQTVLRRYDELEAHLRDELGVTPSEAAVVLRDRALDLVAPGAGATSGVRTFLMADVEGATGPSQADSKASTEAGAVLDQLIEDAIQQQGGIVFETTGTRTGAVFGPASDAVAAAVAIQQASQAAPWEGDRPRIRIGLDVGEATYSESAWTGAALDRANRILDAANGDQIVCSELVAHLAAPSLGSGIAVVELGHFRLPGAAPTSLHRVDADGIGQRTGLRASSLGGRPLGPSRDLLIGRDDEVRQLRRLVAGERLVTLVGPGGAGKTHLARHVAGSIAGDFAGGTWMCQLGAVEDAAAVPQEVLTAIGAVQHADATVVESISRALGERRALLVLDNCEHVLEPVVTFCREILHRCPDVTLLATSREPLELAAEQQFQLGELSRDAAIELFVTGSRRRGTELDPADPTLDRICQRLDDLPLAVQLAAARTRTLDPATIESLLDDRFAYLTSTTVDRPDHHATLEAAIAWSFDALGPELQQLLADLSVITGRFTLDEARAVAGGAGTSTAAIVDGVDVLVRRSLLVGPERIDGETVYRLLESIRLFARTRHAGRGSALDRHLAHFTAAAEDNRRRQQHDSLAALRWFQSRWSDLRQAQAHAAASGQLDELCRILVAVGHHCGDTGELEILEWCARGLDPAPSTIHGPRHVEALATWGWLALRRGEVELARALVEQASAVDSEHAEILRANAMIAWSRGDHLEAAQTVEQLLQRTDIEPSLEAGLLMFRAILVSGMRGDAAPIAQRLEAVAVGRGPLFEARALFGEAVASAWTEPRAASDHLDECQFLTDRYDLVDIGAAVRLVRGWIAPAVAGEPLDVLELMGRNISWLQERGLWSYALVQLGSSAPTFASLDRVDLTVTLLSSCRANGFTTNFQAGVIEALLDDAQTEHGARYHEWWETGQRLDPSATCGLALAAIEQLRHAC